MTARSFDCLADTSAVILSARNPGAAPLQDKKYALAFVTLAELWVGILRSARRASASRQLDPWLHGRQMLAPSPLTSAVYARVAYDLQLAGQPIPVNDLWIAALAIQLDLPLVARDDHFSRVPGLRLVAV